MKELVVISGKGGTGKTSIAGSLAALSNNKVLVDCDVDAADLHLIIDSKVTQKEDFIGGKQAFIDEKKCSNCGVCQNYCRFDAIKSTNKEGDDKFWIDPYACDGCGVCVRHCPENAIEFNDVISGEWYLSDSSHGPFVHAKLGIAQANSGKLVSLLRREAKQIAEEKEAELIIVDGPPGIGCPVIASVTGASYILIVTEPSMSAIHDMERLLQLVTHFGIFVGICINKFDINQELTAQIEKFANEKNVKILGRIPFDASVINAQIAGTSIVAHEANEVSESIKKLWYNLKQEIEDEKSTNSNIININLTNKTNNGVKK